MEKFVERQPEVSGVRGWTYQTVVAFYLGLTGGKIGNDITPASVLSVAAAMRAAPAQHLPLGAGIMFKCDGTAFAPQPAYCTTGTLQTSLHADGKFVNFKSVDTSESLKAIEAAMTKK